MDATRLAFSSLLGNNPAEQARVQAQVGNVSVAYILATRANAVADLGGPLGLGSFVYVNPSPYVGKQLAGIEGTLLHELLHNIGLTDLKIGLAFANADDKYTGDASSELTKKCF